MKSKIGKNILANVLGKIWTAVVSLFFVPIFIKIMGEEAYGIVTYFAVLQSVLNIMGVGLQRTLRREFSKAGDNTEVINRYKFKMLRSSEFIYFIVFLLIFQLCYLGSGVIANNWLLYETLNPSDVEIAIVLMGVSIGLQLLANLYAGGIYGLDLQELANGLQIAWVTLKNAGVIPIIILTNGSIIYFFVWMLLIDLVYSVTLRSVLIKRIPTIMKKTWNIKDLSLLKNIWNYTGGLFLISIGTALNTQLDKIIMSKSLTIVDCGAYNCAFHLGSFSSYIPTIIGTAIFSNIASLIFQNKRDEAEALFKPMNRLSVVFVTVMSSFIALFSYELILVWTKSEIYADVMRQAAPLVIFGYMLNALQQVPYDYLLAQGVTKLNQVAIAISIPYVCTVTVYLTKTYGVMGASVAWFIQLFILTNIYLLAFYWICFKKNGLLWLWKDNYRIFLIAFIPAFLLRLLLNQFILGALFTVIVAFSGAGLTVSVLLYFFERKTIKRFIVLR